MTIHKMWNSSEYQTWQDMKQRCMNSNNKRFSDYGGRGISVCKAWQESFETFYQDMGARPSESHSIERRNNDGDYTPDNCYWADKTTQAINRRIQKNNKSGYIGIYWNKTAKKWRSEITVKKVTFFIGYFSDPKDAAIARDEYILENELSEYSLQVLPEPQ